MSNILVTVNEQELHITNAPKIASQGVYENYIIFTFDNSWFGFSKIALFYREDDEDTVYQSIINTNGVALIPHEVTDEDGKICFSVAGVKSNIIYTSEILSYKIVKGLYITDGSISQPPTPGIYEQLLTAIVQFQTTINDLVSAQESFETELTERVDNIIERETTGAIQGSRLVDFTSAAIEITSSGNTQTVNLTSEATEFAGMQDLTNPVLLGVGFYVLDTADQALTQLRLRTDDYLDGVNFYDGGYYNTSNLADIRCIQLGIPTNIDNTSIVGKYVKFVATFATSESVDLTEVIDIRSGADGTTYGTAGTAIRTQLNKKVNVPLFSGIVNNGVSGQVLKTNGDGSTYWDNESGGGSGLTTAIKNALLACFENVVWIDNDGQTYYDALEDALNDESEPSVNLVFISAAYTQSGIVYDSASLNDLKSDLIVTATYTDSSTETISSTDYTLSGTLAEGTCTITVSYEGKTTTFNVIVSAAEWTIVRTIDDNYETGLLSFSDGTVSENTGWYTSGFLTVPDGATSFSRITSRESDYYLTWYDENQAYIGSGLHATYSGNGNYGGGYTDTNGVLWNVVPSTAKYCKVSWRTSATYTSVTFKRNAQLSDDVTPMTDRVYFYTYDSTSSDNYNLNDDYLKCEGMAYAHIRPILRRYINFYDADYIQVGNIATENNIGNNVVIPSDAVYLKMSNTNVMTKSTNGTTRIGTGLIMFTDTEKSSW